MFGQNPLRAPLKGDGATLQVQHIFPTLQGEGPFTGVPSIFIRLGGCNLACSFCDTEFETFETMTLDAILASVSKLSNSTPLIVITGGEPFRQPIRPLCEALLAKGYKVQIETNGTLYRDIPEAVQIICSPKTVNGRYVPIRDDVMRRALGVKFIVSSAKSDYTAVAQVGQSVYGTPVYVQPMDEYDETVNRNNLHHAVRIAANGGYRLCLQTHKMLGIE